MPKSESEKTYVVLIYQRAGVDLEPEIALQDEKSTQKFIKQAAIRKKHILARFPLLGDALSPSSFIEAIEALDDAAGGSHSLHAILEEIVLQTWLAAQVK